MAIILQESQLTHWYEQLNFARTQSNIGLSSLPVASGTSVQTSTRIKKLVSDIVSTMNANSFLGMADNTIVSSNLDSGDIIRTVDKNTIDATMTSLLRICPNVSCKTTCTNTGTYSNTANTNGPCTNALNSNGDNSNGPCTQGVNNNGANSYSACSNGTCSNVVNGNGNNGNGTCSNVLKGNGTNTNGKNSVGWHSLNYTNGGTSNGHCWFGGCENGTCGNGTCSNVANGNGNNSNGTCSNVPKSNGTNTNGNHGNGTCSNVSKSNGNHTNGTCSNVSKSNGTNTNGNKDNGCAHEIYDSTTATYSAKNHYTEAEANNRV